MRSKLNKLQHVSGGNFKVEITDNKGVKMTAIIPKNADIEQAMSIKVGRDATFARQKAINNIIKQIKQIKQLKTNEN